MKSNKYEKALIDNVAYLDAITHSDGKIIDCARLVIENNDKAAIQLCNYFNNSADYGNAQITKIAISAKDALISYYGYKRLTSICSSENVPEDDNHSLEELLDQLNKLVGLNKVKAKVNDLIAFQKVQMLRKTKGLHTPKSTMHLAFTGNPGTGKTTVARIIGRIYKKIGVLSKGHFMEVSRTDLIAGYQGQTAQKVKDVIDKAKGGVLFIDEAYSITENDHTDSYGRECLTELTKALEDYRDNLVVIVAGYTEPMRQFFDSNPGLRSRFNTFIEFDDYNADELMQIIKNMCVKEDYSLTEKSAMVLGKLISEAVEGKEKDFANGRFVRNIFETVLMNHARRVAKMESPTILELKEITERDIPFDYKIHSK